MLLSSVVRLNRHTLQKTGANALTLMGTEVTHPLTKYNKYAVTFFIIQTINQQVIKTI
jgi:hypothetical protein